MINLRISTLGRFSASANHQPIPSFATDKVRALFVYLVLEADRRHRRESLATMLWPDFGEADARRSLRQTLFRLKQALNGAEPKLADQLLDISRLDVALRGSGHLTVNADVVHFCRATAECFRHEHHGLHTCSACLTQLSQTLALYHGDFLPGFSLPDAPQFEAWLRGQREYANRLAVQGLEQLSEAYLARGEPVQAAEFATRLIELEPWNEVAHRCLMQTYLLQGRRADVSAQYERCVQALEEELGVAPGEEIKAVLHQAEAPSLATTLTHPRFENDSRVVSLHNFPTQPTPFVGRKVEIARILDHLIDPEYRLLTLIGPGGAGKTRLAIEAARSLASRPGLVDQRYPDGVFFVSLADVVSNTQVWANLAGALHFTPDGQADITQQVLGLLGGKQLLLILDNLEQFLAPQPNRQFLHTLSAILNAAPRSSILATSREALNLRAERRLLINGLDMSSANPDDPTVTETPVGASSETSPETPVETEAIRLFVQAARQVRPSFAVSGSNWDNINRICLLVEGMPLALEIASGWLRLMSSEQIVERIEESIDFLERPAWDIPERHHSMRAVFETSWHLLTTAEQVLMARLSIFANGFNLEAVQHVAQATPHAIAALVDKSLLQRTSEGRYSLHLLLRQYASERLREVPDDSDGGGQPAALLSRHSGYFLALLSGNEETPDALIPGAERSALEQDLDNIRRAWDRATNIADAEALGSACMRLCQLYRVMGLFQEGAARFAEAVARLRQIDIPAHATEDSITDCSHTARAIALLQLALSSMLTEMAQYRVAHETLLQSLAYWTTLDDLNRISQVECEIGIINWRLGEFDEARAHIRRSLDLAESLGDRARIAYALHHLGNLEGTIRDDELFTDFLKRALSIYEELGDRRRQAGILNDIGGWLLGSPRQSESEHYFQRSLTLIRAVGDEPGALLPMTNLGYMQACMDNLDRAEEIMMVTDELAQRLQHRHFIVGNLINLGHVRALAGRIDKALDCYRRAIHLQDTFDIEAHRADTEIGVAYVCAMSGRAMEAATILSLDDATQSGRFTATVERRMLDEAWTAIRKSLTSGEITAAQERSRAISPESRNDLLRRYLRDA